jgi:hypothetical protein
MTLTDEWLIPEEILQKRATEHSHQIRAAQEKRISQTEKGFSVEPQREREPNSEPSTQAPLSSLPHAEFERSAPQTARKEPITAPGTPVDIAPKRELFPSIRSPQREPATEKPSQIQPEPPPQVPSPARGSRRQDTAPVRYPQWEPGFMHHFNLLLATGSATFSPPSVQFKETNQPQQAAAFHLAAMIPNDQVTM